jgi:hypothetical protein
VEDPRDPRTLQSQASVVAKELDTHVEDFLPPARGRPLQFLAADALTMKSARAAGRPTPTSWSRPASTLMRTARFRGRRLLGRVCGQLADPCSAASTPTVGLG